MNKPTKKKVLLWSCEVLLLMSNVNTSSPICGTKGDFLGMTSVIHGEGLNSLDTSLLMDGLAFGR